MLNIKEAVIVEGKYDKSLIRRVTNAVVIETNGFSIYTDSDLIKSIRHFACTTGIIILTDSDGAGFRIRNYIKSCVGKNASVKHAYIPAVAGKEKRKSQSGKEGILGVEGMDEEIIRDILLNVSEEIPPFNDSMLITKNTFFEDGLTGCADSAARRMLLIKQLKLPPRLSCNALLDIMNKRYGYDQYKKIINAINFAE